MGNSFLDDDDDDDGGGQRKDGKMEREYNAKNTRVRKSNER